MINKELKKQIISWLLENENTFNRFCFCVENFRAYIYDKDGNYLIGGEQVHDFIEKIDDAIYEN